MNSRLDSSRSYTRSPARGRFFARLIALASLAAAVALPAATSNAQTVGELNSRIATAQSQAQSLSAEIDAKGAQLVAARQQAAAAAAREDQLSSVLAQGQQREAELQA